MKKSPGAHVVWTIAVVLSLTIVGTSIAGSTSTWKLTALYGPTGTDWEGTVANDVSDLGLVGGAWIDEDFRFHGAYWRRGKAYDVATEIGIPTGTTLSNVYSVNAAGVMGGTASSLDGWTVVAMLWDTKKDTWTNLHPDDDTALTSGIAGINGWGDAAGYVMELAPSHPWGVHFRACVWLKKDSTATFLPGTDEYFYSEATGINAWRTISGFAVTTAGAWHAVIWKRTKNGTYELIDLQDDEFDDDLVQSTATDVGERGTVVGYGWYDRDHRQLAYTWTAKGGLSFLDEDDTGRSVAYKAAGTLVAGGIGAGSWSGGPVSDDAAVWIRGKLKVVATSWGDYDSLEASSVNRWGTVVGAAFLEPDADDPDSNYPLAFSARFSCR